MNIRSRKQHDHKRLNKNKLTQVIINFLLLVIIAVKFHYFPGVHNGEFFQDLNYFHLYDNQIIMIEVVYGHKVVSPI